MAYCLAVRPAGGERTWTVVDASYATVGPAEERLEAHRYLWSPNTVRGYAASLAQWWSFLEQRGEAGRWTEVGVPAVSGFLSWLRNGRTVEDAVAVPAGGPSAETLHARLAALVSFYQWQEAVHSVPVAGRLLRGRAARMPSRGLLAHLDGRRDPGSSSLVKVRRHRRDRPPLLLPQEIQAIIDGCAAWDEAAGEWKGNLRDRLFFSILAESGMRLGEVLGMAISDFVMGRGGTPYIEVVPREGNPKGARVKMMRPRRVYVTADLERLFADYLTHMACRAADHGLPVTQDSPLPGAGGPPLSAAVRHARAIEIRQQISQLAAILADTASGQQELFASPGTARAARPAETAQALHHLITELAALAATMTVTKRVTLAGAPAQMPQTAPLFGHPGNPHKDTS